MFFSIQPPVFRCAIALALVLVFFGCNTSDDKVSDKLEHIAPPHKPRGFPALVIALRERIASLSTGNSSKEDLDRLSDVIHWIPELAAETDLKRKEWDVAADVSEKLKVGFDAARMRGSFDREEVKKLLDLADLLQPLANLCVPRDS